MDKPSEIAGDIFGRLRGIAKSIVEGHGGIFRELAKEHGEVNVLFKRVSMSKDPDVRREFFPKIREELLSHAKAEEREFYMPLRGHEDVRLLIEQALLDHQEMEQMITELMVLDYEDPTWVERFKRLEDAVVAHVEMEENEIFAKAKDLLSKDQLEVIEKRFETSRRAELEVLALH